MEEREETEQLEDKKERREGKEVEQQVLHQRMKRSSRYSSR